MSFSKYVETIVSWLFALFVIAFCVYFAGSLVGSGVSDLGSAFKEYRYDKSDPKNAVTVYILDITTRCPTDFVKSRQCHLHHKSEFSIIPPTLAIREEMLAAGNASYLPRQSNSANSPAAYFSLRPDKMSEGVHLRVDRTPKVVVSVWTHLLPP